MKILAIITAAEGTSPERMQDYLVEENKIVWDLYKSGLIREMYFRSDVLGAVFVFECANLAEAQQALNQLPLIEAGILMAQIIPLAPFTNLEFAFAK